MELHNDTRNVGAFELLMRAIDVLQVKSFIPDGFLRNLKISVVSGGLDKMVNSQGGLRTIETAMKANLNPPDGRSEGILAVVSASISTGSYITHTVQADGGFDVYTLYHDGSLSVTFSQPQLTVFSLDARGLVVTGLTANPGQLKKGLVSAAQRHW